MAAFEQKFTLGVPSSTQNLALIREFVTNDIRFLYQF